MGGARGQASLAVARTNQELDEPHLKSHVGLVKREVVRILRSASSVFRYMACLVQRNAQLSSLLHEELIDRVVSFTPRDIVSIPSVAFGVLHGSNVVCWSHGRLRTIAYTGS